MYDLVIIGSGPAGMAAAIYAGRAKLNAIMVERNGFGGGAVMNTYEVDNYPGLPGESGFSLSEKLEEHAKRMGAVTVTDEVKEIVADTGFYRVICETQIYETKGVMIATGANHAKLGVPGEEELAGVGVSYCATCDGAFFADREVAVVGGGDVAVEDAIFLARSCKKVYLIHRRDSLRAAKVLQDALLALDNVEVVWDSIVEQISGDDCVEDIRIKNVKTGEKKSLPVQGVFVAVGIRPNSELFRTFVECDEAGYIIAGENGRTSRPCVYAIGDVRTKELRQIVTAVSDGANAVTSLQTDLTMGKTEQIG